MNEITILELGGPDPHKDEMHRIRAYVAHGAAETPLDDVEAAFYSHLDKRLGPNKIIRDSQRGFLHLSHCKIEPSGTGYFGIYAVWEPLPEPALKGKE